MKSLMRYLMFSLLLLVFTSAAVFAQELAGRVTNGPLNVRNAQSISPDSIVGRLAADTMIVIQGRSSRSDWLYIRTQDGSLEGWVAARYIDFDSTQIGSIPVKTDDASGEAISNSMESGSEELVMGTPIFSNFDSPTVRATFARGQRLGNNPRVFMKVGDSVTATQPFLYGFGTGEYNLGPYSNLQATIDFFSVSPREGFANSWVYMGASAAPGFVSGAVFDGTWSPEYCGELLPLDCDVNVLRPSVAIVLFGGQDERLFDWGFFATNMRRIASDLKSQGVIPVFTTFPMHASYNPELTTTFNSIVIELANEQGIPLINLYRALQDLPDGGAKPDDVVHLTQGEQYFNFNGDEALYGVTLRNLLTLQALDMLRTGVLDR